MIAASRLAEAQSNHAESAFRGNAGARENEDFHGGFPMFFAARNGVPKL